jgi:hypothetical protein
MSPVRISAGTPTILTEGFRDFFSPTKTAGIVPKIGHGTFIPHPFELPTTAAQARLQAAPYDIYGGRNGT